MSNTYAASTAGDSAGAFSTCGSCASVANPVSPDVGLTISTGKTTTFGTDVSLGITPIFNVNWHMTTSYDSQTAVTIYGGKSCGVTDASARCFWYHVAASDDPNAAECTSDLLCFDGDYYTFITSPTRPVPGFCAPDPSTGLLSTTSNPICE
jgi:hypothetical protein